MYVQIFSSSDWLDPELWAILVAVRQFFLELGGLACFGYTEVSL